MADFDSLTWSDQRVCALLGRQPCPFSAAYLEMKNESHSGS